MSMARLVGDSRRMVRACWAHTAKHKETHTTSAGLHKETQMKAHTANHERTIERLHDRVGRRRCTCGEKNNTTPVNSLRGSQELRLQ